MILLDVNLLVYQYDVHSFAHARVKSWLDRHIEQDVQIGLPWPTLLGFLRLICNPSVMSGAKTPAQAWQIAERYLAHPNFWIPRPTEQHASILGRLLTQSPGLSPRVIHDAHLAALAIEHGLILCSTDTDFARFDGLRWENPLGGPGAVREGLVRYRTRKAPRASPS